VECKHPSFITHRTPYGRVIPVCSVCMKGMDYTSTNDKIIADIQEQVGPPYPVQIDPVEVEYIAGLEGIYRELAIKKAVLAQLEMRLSKPDLQAALKCKINEMAVLISNSETNSYKYAPLESLSDYTKLNELAGQMSYNMGKTVDKILEDEEKKEKLKEQIELQKQVIQNAKKKQNFLNGKKIKDSIAQKEAALQQLEAAYAKQASYQQATQNSWAQSGMAGMAGQYTGVFPVLEVDGVTSTAAVQKPVNVPAPSVLMVPEVGPRKMREEA
jgi:hypothetical protein